MAGLTESEAGVGDVNALVDFLVERRIKAIFVESSVSDSNVTALIQKMNERAMTGTVVGSPITIQVRSFG